MGRLFGLGVNPKQTRPLDSNFYPLILYIIRVKGGKWGYLVSYWLMLKVLACDWLRGPPHYPLTFRIFPTQVVQFLNCWFHVSVSSLTLVVLSCDYDGLLK